MQKNLEDVALTPHTQYCIIKEENKKSKYKNYGGHEPNL